MPVTLQFERVQKKWRGMGVWPAQPCGSNSRPTRHRQIYLCLPGRFGVVERQTNGVCRRAMGTTHEFARVLLSSLAGCAALPRPLGKCV